MADHTPSGPEVTPEMIKARAESDEKVSFAANKLISDFESIHGGAPEPYDGFGIDRGQHMFALFTRRLNETQMCDVLGIDGEPVREANGAPRRELCPSAKLAIKRAHTRWHVASSATGEAERPAS